MSKYTSKHLESQRINSTFHKVSLSSSEEVAGLCDDPIVAVYESNNGSTVIMDKRSIILPLSYAAAKRLHEALSRYLELGETEIAALWEEAFNEQVVKHNSQYLPKDTTRPAKRPGYVYLLKSSSGFYKIGRAQNPTNRLKTFTVKMPFEVEYEHLLKTNNPKDLEQFFHKRFADKRVNGEWFALTPSDIEFIKSYKEGAQ